VLTALIEPRAAALFDRLTGELGLPPRFVAVLLGQRLKGLRRRGVPVDTLTPEEIYAVCAAHAKGRLTREGLPVVLRLVAEHGPVAGGVEAARVAAVFAEHNFTPLTDAELDEAISRRLARLDSRKFATPQQKARYLCGLILDDFVGRVPAAKVVQRLAARLPVAAPVSSPP